MKLKEATLLKVKTSFDDFKMQGSVVLNTRNKYDANNDMQNSRHVSGRS